MTRLAVGDAVTWLAHDHTAIHAYITRAVPKGYSAASARPLPRAHEKLAAPDYLYIAEDSEGVTWLRGHHDVETSPELQALLVERALLR